MKKQIILIPFFALFAFCTSTAQKEAMSSQISHVDEIHMQYIQDNFYLPILKAMVNDTLTLDVFFDTGVPGRYIIASDSLTNVIPSDSVSIQIGKQRTVMNVDFMNSKRNNIFQVLGANTIIVGWEFFKGKIIELSFDKQYIRVYENLPDVTEYSKVKITATSHLEIPVEIVLQGKTIQEKALIDTGNNSYASFNTKLTEDYKIDTSEAYHGKNMTNIGLLSGYSLPVDTIKIAGIGVTKPNMRVAFRPESSGRKAVTLLGVKTLDNFSLFLDLIKYDLYLKPVEK